MKMLPKKNNNKKYTNKLINQEKLWRSCGFPIPVKVASLFKEMLCSEFNQSELCRNDADGTKTVIVNILEIITWITFGHQFQ